MKWISSTGGPLICADENIACYWRGLNGLSHQSELTSQNDYERACASALREYIEAIPCEGGKVLVLGDEPAQSSFFHTREGELTIARWIYADESNIDNLLYSLDGRINQIGSSLIFEIRTNRLVLFDAAFDGRNKNKEIIKTPIEMGQYNLSVEEIISKERRFRFVIHRFHKIMN